MALLKLSISIASTCAALRIPHSSESRRSGAVALSWKQACSPFQAALSSMATSARALPAGAALPILAASQATGVSASAEELDAQCGTKGVKVQSGEGGLTKVVLSTTAGSEAEVYLYGGCITSWKSSKGKDLLFVRPDAVFNGQKPISGGIPHCFPQFGPGPIQQHGFARNVSWEIASAKSDDKTTSLVLKLQPSDYSRNIWDHDFLITFKIVLGGDTLTTELVVKNTDRKPFSFTTALHSYYAADSAKASVTGLKGGKRLDKPVDDPAHPVEGKENRDVVNFPGFVDTMYPNSPCELVLDNGYGTKLSIRNEGWTDAVLWNPHLTMESSYKNFVCVENAKLAPVELQPGASWTAKQFLSPK